MKTKKTLPITVKILLLIFAIAIVGTLAFFITVWALYRNVKRSITIELGEPLPAASAFLKEEGTAEYAEPVEISLTAEGSYELTLCTGIWRRPVTLEVKDTMPPSAEGIDTVVGINEVLQPEDVLDNVYDASTITCAWTSEPDFCNVGQYDTAVLLTDFYGNSSEVQVRITVISCIHELTIEAGNPLPKVNEFLLSKGEEASCSDLESIDSSVPGDYPLTLTFKNESYFAMLHIVDTIAPIGAAVNCETHTGYPLNADDFVTDVSDVTPVSISFASEPDWSGEGLQKIYIRLEDTSGNCTEIEAECNLIKEYEAPELWGVNDRYCYVGEPVAYLQNVYVVDNYDETDAITITVDKESVNVREAGDYTVTYTATDRSGNSVTKSAVFHFIEPQVSEEELNALVDDILNEILTDDMTLTEQARAIFDYVTDNIWYNDGSNITDWQLEAYRGFTTGQGDCFTYFSCSYVLLSRIDVEVIPIQREINYLHHFWCLVNVGNGWYHFDPTNFNTDKIPHGWAFMRTTEELWNMPSGTYFWSFNASKYPEIATEKFVPPEDTEG